VSDLKVFKKDNQAAYKRLTQRPLGLVVDPTKTE